MSAYPLTGSLVVLKPIVMETFSEAVSRWSQNGEYSRLANADEAVLWTRPQTREFFEKEIDSFYGFAIHALDGDRLIGSIDLGGFDAAARNAWVGIGIGEAEFWGKGYGTEAMRLILRFGFEELNLNRVSLDVFEYNQRGVRSYLKCGFKEEGRHRQALLRGERRWDLIFMGILREEWLAQTAP